jgi:hypothetical protein
VIDATAIWVAAIPTAGVIISAYLTNRGQSQTHRKVDAVAEEVTTINGKTMANLADEAEQRRTNGHDE